MSLSAEHRAPDHNSSHDDHSSFRDLIQSPDDRKDATQDHCGRKDPLVEHVLDFLDKYPACFAPDASLANWMRA